MTMRDKAECIMRESIQRVMPGPAVTTALQNCKFSEGRLYLVAVGKAAWEMANSAVQCLDKKVCAGIVLTKYGHVQGLLKMSFAMRPVILSLTRTHFEERRLSFGW